MARVAEPERIVLLTPTQAARSAYWPQAARCFAHQTYQPRGALQWLIVLDGCASGDAAIDARAERACRAIVERELEPDDRERVHVRSAPHASTGTIGAKRNAANRLALALGAAYICSMDDDDYYAPRYVSVMMSLLREGACHTPPRLIAGGSASYIYFSHNRTVYASRPFGPSHSCHGALCYARAYLDTHSYDETRTSGEEPGFLEKFSVPMMQWPRVCSPSDVLTVALTHSANTVDRTAHLENNVRAGGMFPCSFSVLDVVVSTLHSAGQEQEDRSKRTIAFYAEHAPAGPVKK